MVQAHGRIAETPGRSVNRGMATLSILETTPQRLWIWGIRSCLCAADQAMNSGGSFLLNVLLARWLTREAFGAFAVSFAAFLFLSGFHNVIFIEPMTVIGPSCYSQRLTDYFSAQLRAHIVLVGALSAVCLLAAGVLALRNPGSPLAAVILAAGASVPFLLLLWLARRMCYVVQNPLIATQASASYSVLLLGGAFGLRQLGWLNPTTAFLWMACISLLVSVFILGRLGVSFALFPAKNSISLRQLLNENGGYGRWLTLTTALSWISVQAQTFLAAGFLGLAGAGVLRAMQLPSLGMTQAIAATTLLILPSMSQDLGRGNVARLRKKAILSTVFLATLAILFVAGLFLFAGPLDRLLFGQKYSSSAWLMPVLGLVPVFTGFSASLSLALRALRKSQFELLAYVLSATSALVSALLLMPRWGLAGAAASIVGSTAVLAMAVSVCFLKWGKG